MAMKICLFLACLGSYTLAAGPAAYATLTNTADLLGAVGSSHENTIKSYGGQNVHSTYSKSIDGPHSSVRIYDSRTTNDGLLGGGYSTGIYSTASPAVYPTAPPAVGYSTLAPSTYALPAFKTVTAAPTIVSHGAPAISYAAPAIRTYATAAPTVAYAGPAVSYASPALRTFSLAPASPTFSYASPAIRTSYATGGSGFSYGGYGSPAALSLAAGTAYSIGHTGHPISYGSPGFHAYGSAPAFSIGHPRQTVLSAYGGPSIRTLAPYGGGYRGYGLPAYAPSYRGLAGPIAAGVVSHANFAGLGANYAW